MPIRPVSVSFALILFSLVPAQTTIPPVPRPLEFPPPKLLPAGKDFPVTDFGAVPDSKTLNTAAIQKTIDACTAQGGGTVVVARTAEGNTFLTGAIFLKRGVNFRVEKDTLLKGSTNPADYPIVDTRFEGIERPFMCGLINATNLDGFTIGGEGTIDGSGDECIAARRGGRGRGAPARL